MKTDRQELRDRLTSAHLIHALSTILSADFSATIDKLTGYLWTPEEATLIKATNCGIANENIATPNDRRNDEWRDLTALPQLVDDATGYGWPSSVPVLVYCSDGKMRGATLEKVDEDEPPTWYSNCSERWNLGGKVTHWKPLPAPPSA